MVTRAPSTAKALRIIGAPSRGDAAPQCAVRRYDGAASRVVACSECIESCRVFLKRLRNKRLFLKRLFLKMRTS